MEHLEELLTKAIKLGIINEETSANLIKLASEEHIFENDNNPYNPLQEVLTFVEVSNKYNISESALRMNIKYGRYEDNEVRQSGKTWLTTKKMVSRLYPTKYLKVIEEEKGGLCNED